ncbi:hypothetical protein M0813_28383 [Anaeramoeba flamelloides]|uniref:Transmembrane protein n=1 Tax=Anaeramoeba flamelloides TaxID=1746091 RepID=A0AAV7ZLL3_9EUKA|nr:hypothetical protein M0812_14410 [Anaeramoeba flamelloides]KAJ6235823.1 hypothetical protein M0813_28383 [Anaeramoeba flamelloides]
MNEILQRDLKIDTLPPQKIAGAFTLLIIITHIIFITSEHTSKDFKTVSETYKLTAPYPAKQQLQIDNLNHLNHFLTTTITFKSNLPIGMVVSPTINVTTYGSDTSNTINTHRSVDLSIQCQADGNCSTIQIDYQNYLKYSKYIVDLEINDDSDYFLFEELHLKPKESRTFTKFYLPRIFLISILWIFLLAQIYNQPGIKLYQTPSDLNKKFLYFYASLFLIILTWCWGKTRRFLKQKRYIKRFTFFVVPSIPILFLCWFKVAKYVILDKKNSAQQIADVWFILIVYLIFMSYGWIYQNPKELVQYYSSNNYSLGSDKNVEKDIEELQEKEK